MDKDRTKTLGLHAAGTNACSMYGDTVVSVLRGNISGLVSNGGFIAEEKAAEAITRA